MSVNQANFNRLKAISEKSNAQLIAVVKNRTIEEIMQLYQLGQRHMAINRVQELTEKSAALPQDIVWHLIGPLQKNKTKKAVEICSCIQSVDSVELLLEIEKRASQLKKKIDVLLQVHIAQEQSKIGWKPEYLIFEIEQIMNIPLVKTQIKGLMGMATFSDNRAKIKEEFSALESIYLRFQKKWPQKFTTLSMGMSSDYDLALEAGSNYLRVGRVLFD